MRNTFGHFKNLRLRKLGRLTLRRDAAAARKLELQSAGSPLKSLLLRRQHALLCSELDSLRIAPPGLAITWEALLVPAAEMGKL
jgi:hypothetical protein